MTAICRALAFPFAFLVLAHPAVYELQPNPTSVHWSHDQRKQRAILP